VSPTDKGWRQDGGCSGEPEVNDPGETVSDRGTLRPNAPRVELPPSNVTLRDDAMPGYRFRGRVTIRLDNTQMYVTGERETGTVLNNFAMPLPRDGVIYVSNKSTPACLGYDPLNPTPAGATGCGDVWVSGTYASSMTINAENDIIVQDDVTAIGSAKPLLGLISNNWIRVHHPVNGSCQNSGGPGAIRIEAAILSLRHSFAVDNFWCGSKLGDLTVFGAIAQKYRGIVGAGDHGYIKDYNYNPELRFRSPPRFLDPVQSTWRIKSQVEQVPAS
jgi:hypothetical protein